MSAAAAFRPPPPFPAETPAGEIDPPYPAFPMPAYRPLAAEGWRCHLFGDHIGGPGYFTRRRDHAALCFGLMRTDGEAWMTTAPMEIESQAPHLAAAEGHVLVGGLGLALMAYALTEKPAVPRVTVVERDSALIRLAPRFAEIDLWPQRAKLRIVEADLLAWRPDPADPPVDFLYVDIWRGYRAEPKIENVQAVQAEARAPKVGYWGQEVDAVDWAAGRGIAPESFDAAAFEAFRAATGLPLIGLEEPLYPELCRRAAANPDIGDRATAERIAAAEATRPLTQGLVRPF
ncbi:MAG: hypothetical protein RIB45_16035 [Marivibrio sp.]|uniref:hypothetical protein n=1 Tax=Marivibrio sp. TaxID=2039719 RepID=UPI0032EACA81